MGVDVSAGGITIGQLLALAREMKGLTLRQLEKKTGIDHALIAKIERGDVKDPGFSRVVILSRALGVSVARAAATVAKPE